MKKLILILALIINLSAFSQDDKTVTLVVSGQGKTQDEAKQNALRSAIEQAFGTFISSKTEILNDSLVKDEIVSIANGNIQEFDIISEVQIPDGGYATTLKATVSVTKLTSFVESKGVEVEFKGSLFGANLRQQKLNEEAEYKAILNLCETSNEILSNSLDYSIEASDPIKAERRKNSDLNQDEYQVTYTIKLSPNKNFDEFIKYFYSNIKSISMAVPEIEDYKKLNKETYFLKINNSERYFFRNSKTSIALQNLFFKSNKFLQKYKILTNIDSVSFNYKSKIIYVNDNSGFPQFNFPPEPIFNACRTDRGLGMETIEFLERGYNNSMISSWKVYSSYIIYLENFKILFDSDNYFKESASFFIENGNPDYHSRPKYPINQFPGIITKIIGYMNFEKISYFIKYSTIYSEEQISKLSNISVKPIK
jgi:hypothetical protein